MKTIQQLTETLTWTLDNGTLTISGTGAMPDYTYHPFTSSPWYKDRDTITTVNIQDGVTSIGDITFSECSSLTSITIPNSVKKIGHSAFSGCSSLTSLTIPASVTEIGGGAFVDCSSLSNVVVLSTTPPALELNPFCDVPFPLSSATLTVPNWCMEAYKNAEGWNEFGTIVEMGWTLGNGTLTIVANIQFIFNIDTWTLDNGTLTIGGTGDIPYSSPWHKYSGNITTVNIQDGVTSIGDDAFVDCSSLTSITIPNSVTSIGKEAFCNCSSLASITIPNSVTSIGTYAFQNCSSLTSITVGSGNTAYASEDGVLFDRSKRTIIRCPAGKTGSYTIPNSVTTIGGAAFSNCSSLTPITIPNSVTTIGGAAFVSCSSLTSITIPNSVTTIGDHAFLGCSVLISITIPNSVTTIEDGAFYYCNSLASITIGNSVKRIGKEAFSCTDLRYVVVLNTTPPAIGDDAFDDDTLSSATLTVPKRCKGAYKRAAGWKGFGTIVEMNN